VIFVDANIPMYAAGTPHPLRAPCQEITLAIADGSLDVVTDVEVIQEILHRYTSIGQRMRAVALAREFAALVGAILPVTSVEMTLSIDLHVAHQRLTARDSLHLAVMRLNQLTAILSADRHFDELPGIERIDPVEWTRLLPGQE
jgi:predicted nucleic acid-binding protein